MHVLKHTTYILLNISKSMPGDNQACWKPALKPWHCMLPQPSREEALLSSEPGVVPKHSGYGPKTKAKGTGNSNYQGS